MNRYYSLTVQGPPAFVLEIAGNPPFSHDGYDSAAVLCLAPASAAELAGALRALCVVYDLHPLQSRPAVTASEEE